MYVLEVALNSGRYSTNDLFCLHFLAMLSSCFYIEVPVRNQCNAVLSNNRDLLCQEFEKKFLPYVKVTGNSFYLRNNKVFTEFLTHRGNS